MAHDFVSRYIELEKNNKNQYFDVLRALVKTNAQLLVSYKKREADKKESDTFILGIYIKRSKASEFEKISNAKLAPRVYIREHI